MRTDDALKLVAEQLKKGNAGRAIQEMETYLTAWPQQPTRERLETIKAEYELMANYWQQGMRDAQLEAQYQRLLQRVYVLYANVWLYRSMLTSPFLTNLSAQARRRRTEWSLSAIRREMEDFVSDVAMLQLEPEDRREEKSRTLYKNHQQQMNALFDYVVTSRMWTDGVGHDFEEMLLSPTIDSVDQQLLVSAITLSLFNQYDMAKFRVLANVYRRSADEVVRQRALVGWALGMDGDCLPIYPEQQAIVRELASSERVSGELTELQMQLVYCLNAERDNTTIQQEIMPDLLKNNSFRITRSGIEELEDDPMEEILNPDASEQRMERLEKNFQRMMDMQRRGSDIYFGGFSQMKRFPFFYDTGNWFVPFYVQHPDIRQFVEKTAGNRFLETLLAQGPFCNSDKYSFVIAFQQVVERLPERMRQMLEHGEATMGELEPEEQHTPAYIRRIYLMDLYRFFRLFPQRSQLRGPFEATDQDLKSCDFFSSQLFADTLLEGHKAEVVRLLQKHKYVVSVETLLDTFKPEYQNAQYYIWNQDYQRALELEPDNVQALAGLARVQYENERLDEALATYSRLTALRPDHLNYQLSLAVCQIGLGQYADALKLLYRLNYEDAENDSINRVLAWALTCEGSKLEQALKIYERLTSGDNPIDEDLHNYGYCLWLSGQVAEAAKQLKDIDRLDATWLQQRGISLPEVRLMEALLAE